MARVLQPYASFIIEDNGLNFYSGKTIPIDSILTNKDQEAAMMLEILNTFYYLKLHDFLTSHKSTKVCQIYELRIWPPYERYFQCTIFLNYIQFQVKNKVFLICLCLK